MGVSLTTHPRFKHELTFMPRLDLEFAIRDGEPLRFTGEDTPSPCFVGLPRRALALDSVAYRGHLADLHPDLVQIFWDMQSFAKMLNEIHDTDRIDAMDYTQHGQSLIYRLLKFSPLGKLQELAKEDAEMHLALVAFTVILLPEYSGQHRRYDLISDQIQKLTAGSRPDSEVKLRFRLWMLVTAAIAATDNADDEWLLPQLSSLLHELGLESWERVHRELRHIIWIPALHDEAGLRLFDTVKHSASGVVRVQM